MTGYWVTTIRVGDEIRLGQIVLIVKTGENGKLQLAIKAPPEVTITKTAAGAT